MAQLVRKFGGLVKRTLRRAGRVLAHDPDVFLEDISGVIYVGANLGQERELLEAHALSVIWIEPVPEIFAELEKNIKNFPRQQAYRYLITDKDDKLYTFHVSNNQGGPHRSLNWLSIKIYGQR
jgi:hypothetical protein